MCHVLFFNKVLNRISRANIVTCDTRNISEGWSKTFFQSHILLQYCGSWHSQHLHGLVKNSLSIAYLAPILWLAALATSPRIVITKSNRISRANIVNSGTRNISKSWSKTMQPHLTPIMPVAAHRTDSWIAEKSFKSPPSISCQYRDLWPSPYPKLSQKRSIACKFQATTLTSNTRCISKAWLRTFFQSCVSCQYRDSRHLQHILGLLKYFNSMPSF